MTTFTDLDTDLSATTIEEGFAMWQLHDGHLLTFGGYTARGLITPGPHWTAVDIGTGGCGNGGRRIIRPVSPEARRMVRRAVVQRWVDTKGLSREQANGLYSADAPYKWELMPRIFEAINDDSCHAAILAFRGDRRRWLEVWGPVVEYYVEGLSCPRTEGFIAAVRGAIEG